MVGIEQAQCIDDLKNLTRRRIPKFAFDYIEEGCNADRAVSRNREALDGVTLIPHYTRSHAEPDLSVNLFGKEYATPMAIAPLGLSGLIWPQASVMHAKTAKQANIPFILSTVATIDIETAAKYAQDNFWFQLYPPSDREICLDLLARLKAVNCENLVVTMDVPAPSRRIKALKSGLSVPPKISAANIWQACLRPQWGMATLRAGLPHFANLTPYMECQTRSMKDTAEFIRMSLRDVVDLNLLQWLRENWQGNLIVKGVLSVEDAMAVRDMGADGIVVSNHGGRQLDAAPSPVESLAQIIEVVGQDMAVLVDSGVESGVDVARFLAQGAQAVLVGRAFMYGVGAGQQAGSDRCAELLRLELQQVMSQLHCKKSQDLGQHLV